MKQNRFLLPLLLALAGLFIAVSGFVVFKVHTLQEEVKREINIITFASIVEQRAYRLLSDFDFYAVNATNEGVQQLANASKSKAEEWQLPRLATELAAIKEEARVNLSGHRSKAIQESLFEIEGICKSITRASREKTSEKSIQLASYWQFTYWLIGAACFMVILLALFSYKVFSAKAKIEGLQNMKSLLLNNSIDVVVTCDEKEEL